MMSDRPMKKPSDWAGGMWWSAYSPDGKTRTTATELTGAIPFFDAQRRKMAMSHLLIGRCESSKIVPTVTVNCFRHAPHL